MRRIIVLATCAAVLLGACSSDKKKSSGTTTTAGASTTIAPRGSTTTGSSTTPTVTDVFPTVTLPCQPLPIPKTPVKSPVAGADVYLVKIDERSDKCVDHVIFSYRSTQSGPPGYEITYGSPPFVEDGSGQPVAVKGNAFIVVKVQPGYGFDFVAGKPSYTGSKSIVPPKTNHVASIVETGDFEGVLTWVIGLDSKRPFTVEATGAPQTQLVVTVS
jgi:hypothetical protein